MLKENITDAIRYWEMRRVAYNAILAVIVIAYFWIGYPASKQNLNPNIALAIFLLAVAANVAYCAAYIPDIFVQTSGFREAWLRLRWIVFATGTLFAAIITRFIAMGMFRAK